MKSGWLFKEKRYEIFTRCNRNFIRFTFVTDGIHPSGFIGGTPLTGGVATVVSVANGATGICDIIRQTIILMDKR